MRIDSITAKPIPDTRGRLTIETTLIIGDLSASASVPSGKSTGEHEAVELDAVQAIENVNGETATALVGRNFNSPDELDAFLIELDGTPNKSRLGANAILSVSIAMMRLFALQENIPLWRAIANRAGTIPSTPKLFVNVMNGGVHVAPYEALAKEGRFRLPFQEYMLVVPGETSTALPIAQKAFAKLGEMLGDVPMGDEGGYAPTFDTLEKPFEILAELVKEFPGTSIAIDAAASQLFQDGAYHLLGRAYSTNELAETYANLAGHFGVRSIEDPFDEHATGDFARLTAAVNGRILVVGDDFICTNPTLIADAINKKAVNAVLIKPNQIGTVMETIEAVQETRAAGLKAICSHRSG
ncbi:phosphopyruvate hydratase, partial [Candidatus Kaiserbacteria bacterium]|nr:phosphopyruvate hydratase [Candidatus Kaiserbacteria bacterium]